MNRTAITGSMLGVVFLSLWTRTFVAAPAAPASVAAPPREAGSETITAKQQEDGPWKASQDFFAGPPDACGGAANPGAQRETKWCIPPNVPVRALIAIVADPVRTHMALTFDRTLEGIQLAAQAKGFVIDRYWLPWSAPRGSSSTAAVQQTPQPEQRRNAPGLVLFRRNARPHSAEPLVVFVFLVADTSTAGIDGGQFAAAVSYVDEVMCDPPSASREPAGGCPPVAPVRVVGPSFSGSLASLRRLADGYPTRHFVVYSGSVSSKCAIAQQGLLDQWPDECGGNVEGERPAPGQPIDQPHLTFRTFAHDTESALQRFVEVAYPNPERDCIRPQIAILSEAATTFGASVGAGSAHQSAQDAQQRCVTTFAFPREIASLRNASRAAGASSQTAGQDPGAKSPFLPLDLNDRTNSSDAPPEYSLPQGPLSKEAVLMNLAAGLGRAHYRYIGIVGTNVLDILFLADFLRAACPDSRLFTMRADLLFERQFDNVPFIGMIAITPYPLLDRELTTESSWREPPVHLPFADEYEEAEYHAVRQTLDEMIPTEAQSTISGFTAAAASARASDLWMLVVGDGGYWPVRLLESATARDASKLTLSPTDFTGTWQMLVVLVSAAAAVHVTVLLLAAPFAPRCRDFALVTAAPVQRMFFMQVGCASLAFGLALLLAPAWRYGRPLSWLSVAATVVLTALVVVAVAIQATGYFRHQWKRRLHADAPDARPATLRRQLLLFSVVWTVTLGMAYAWWRLSTDPTSLRGFFFAYRAVHPLSGVSPSTPMIPLLAAIYLWALFEIWRLRFNRTMGPRLFPQHTATPSVATAHGGPVQPGFATERAITSAIRGFFLRPEYAALFAAAFGLWLFSLHPFHPFDLFEASGFAVVYSMLFGLAVALMLSSGLRLMQLWTVLRGLLNELERSRVRGTFARLEDRSWSFWRQGGEDAEWTNMARALEVVDDFNGATSDGSDSPGEKYVVERIHHVKSQAAVFEQSLTGNPTASDRERAIAALRADIDAIQQAVVATDGSSLVRTALDDARRRVDACASLAGVDDARVLQGALQTFSQRLNGALVAVELIRASARVQDRLRTVRERIRELRGSPGRFTMARALLEYARTRAPSTSGPASQAATGDKVEQAHATEVAIEDLQESLAIGLQWAMATLQEQWSAHALDPNDDKPAGLEARPSTGDRAVVDSRRPAVATRAGQLACVEEYAALRYVAFIRGALGHLRHVMVFVAISFSLVLISLNIYSFEPHRSLIWSFIVIFVATGCLMVIALMQLHRDPIISRITGTTSHSLDLHFYVRVAAFGAVPLLTLLATTFPSLGHWVASFLGPSLEALK